MKICIIGHGGHGKDTLAIILKKRFDLDFKSSSEMANEIFIYDRLKNVLNYNTLEECFNDRHNHRATWHDLIVEYNQENPSRLAEEILQKNDLYVGMRSDRELKDCLKKNMFHWVIGIFDPRKPLENSDSFNIDMWENSDFIISNSGSKEQLEEKVIKIFKRILL